ncbi:uncharacterized protein LOC122266110 [Penaeus japonicus]|uniref:uncharacterized protein LOC122266110 n=1 Tax=Penaeus japonicus TaxID=27405 RepID=UPI001C716B85|nr:uncharacterized protein LOC122266110 [Penaeus japonicus]XP_042891636.1 uncharacterized protein LOC122266110 [Penaeus japonicus]
MTSPNPTSLVARTSMASAEFDSGGSRDFDVDREALFIGDSEKMKTFSVSSDGCRRKEVTTSTVSESREEKGRGPKPWPDVSGQEFAMCDAVRAKMGDEQSARLSDMLKGELGQKLFKGNNGTPPALSGVIRSYEEKIAKLQFEIDAIKLKSERLHRLSLAKWRIFAAEKMRRAKGLTSRARPGRQAKKRQPRSCPMPGCKGKAADVNRHLAQVHKITRPEERREVMQISQSLKHLLHEEI